MTPYNERAEELVKIFCSLGADDQASLISHARELSGLLSLVGGPLDGLEIRVPDGEDWSAPEHTFEYSDLKDSLYERDDFGCLVFRGFVDVVDVVEPQTSPSNVTIIGSCNGVFVDWLRDKRFNVEGGDV